MRILIINTKEYSIPGDWNELSKENLLNVCRIMLLDVDNNYKRILLFGYFTGMPYKQIYKLNKNTYAEIFSIFDYLFHQSRLTKNHFPEIGKMALKGPESGLTNFTFEQYFSQSESYYQMCLADANPENLDNLIFVMYNYKGNPDNNKELSALPENQKLAIFFFYQGSTNFIKHKFRDVFMANGAQKKQDGLEFARLVNCMNKGDVAKNELIKNTNLYEALIHLQLILSDGH